MHAVIILERQVQRNGYSPSFGRRVQAGRVAHGCVWSESTGFEGPAAHPILGLRSCQYLHKWIRLPTFRVLPSKFVISAMSDAKTEADSSREGSIDAAKQYQEFHHLEKTQRSWSVLRHGTGRTHRKLNNPCIRWLRVPFTSNKTPLPPAKSLDDSLLIPEATANFFSLVTFQWITPLLDLGYARPLEAPDLWKLQKDRGAAIVADKITASFTRRLKEADEYNQKLANGEIKPGLKGLWWSIRGNRAAKELEWRQKTGRKKASLVWALNDSVAWWFWSAGLLKVVGDTAQVTSPLVVKVRQLINYHCFLSKIQLISRPLSSSQRNRIVGTDWIHPSQQLGSVSALHSPFSPCS